MVIGLFQGDAVGVSYPLIRPKDPIFMVLQIAQCLNNHRTWNQRAPKCSHLVGRGQQGLCTCITIIIPYIGIVHNDIQEVCGSCRLATAPVLMFARSNCSIDVYLMLNT